jgi:hypothetical protein
MEARRERERQDHLDDLREREVRALEKLAEGNKKDA